MNVAIYEYFQHFTPTGLGWATGFLELGHQIALIRKSEIAITNFPPDTHLIIYFDVPNEDNKITEIKEYKKRNPECIIIGIGTLPKSNYHKYLGTVDFWCGIAYQHLYAESEFAKIGFRYYNIPMGSDKSRFFPLNLQKPFDISFVGTFGQHGHGDRDEKYYLYPALEDKTLVSYYSGFSWNGSPVMNIRAEHLNEVYNSTKVNLNFHYPFEKEESPDNPMSRIDLNGRIFDIALSGNFQLCDHPLVKDLFGGSIAIGTKENWMDLIYYYKDREDERNKLAQISRDIALKYHTWGKRMQLVLDAMKENKK